MPETGRTRALRGLWTGRWEPCGSFTCSAFPALCPERYGRGDREAALLPAPSLLAVCWLSGGLLVMFGSLVN